MKKAQRILRAESSGQAGLAVTVAVLCLFGTTITNAITVFFDDANRAPSDTLVIGGVTISSIGYGSYSVTSQPATRAGSGLGSATMGPADSVDRQEHVAAGQTIGSHLEEGLSLAVDGGFNSITILPHSSVLGSNEPGFLPFDISIWPHGAFAATLWYVTPRDPSPITLNFQSGFLPNRLDMSLISDWGDFYYYQDYLRSHGLPDVTFQFGYTIQSLVYTPVPEPGPAVLLGIGLFWCLRCGPKRIFRRAV